MHQIGIIGASEADEDLTAIAYRAGALVAMSGAVLLCGGMGGVMEAACNGAGDAGGLVVGVLPADEGNRYLQVKIRTGMGDARNAILVRSSDALVAIGGAYGTLSEIGFALKAGKMVCGIQTWDVPRILRTDTPEDAIRRICRHLGIVVPACCLD